MAGPILLLKKMEVIMLTFFCATSGGSNYGFAASRLLTYISCMVHLFCIHRSFNKHLLAHNKSARVRPCVPHACHSFATVYESCR
ncbi:hypothetical protein BXZ70DRAFT_400882 [Cristinia sonorae]|uniref:Secreted protein n=1 Tax=Cristinia sonorae TaxID=1940300 RepID=A0A8K0XTU2_9AGAR|nr:hypothetical protein BXZ70DRAFT_400882 [Cristinia sonorae]